MSITKRSDRDPPNPGRREVIATGLVAVAALPVIGLGAPAIVQAAAGGTPPVGAPNRVVALEEHVTIPELAARIPQARVLARGYAPPEPSQTPSGGQLERELAELEAPRLADMDAAGITLQVLSWAGPGAELLTGDEAVSLAREVNDVVAAAARRHPGRFAGFAHLPMAEPESAAAELERAMGELGFAGAMVNGTTDGRFLDHSSFEPLLARAEQLNAPIYVHPGVPPPAVAAAYYDGLPEALAYRLATSSFGWHAETGVHLMRLVFSGTLERHPGLRFIIGHGGEYLPMAIERATLQSRSDMAETMSRDLGQQLRDQVWVTTSGQFSQPVLRVAVDTFGIDRVLFSVDYPFSANAQGRALLDAMDLSPVDQAKIAHGNADALLGLRA